MLNHGVWSAIKTADGYYKYYNGNTVEWYDYFGLVENQTAWYLAIYNGVVVFCDKSWVYAQSAGHLIIGVDSIAPYTAGENGSIYGCRIDINSGKILPPPMPALSTMQLRLWLLKKGKTDAAVRAVIASLKSPLKEEAEIKWEYAPSFDRDSQFIADLAAAMSWSDEWLDSEWQKAAQIS